jgi:NhaP-type Na+/H+ or K+/H+ antiporter/Trk K+ transport system NAD-binding subunit
MEQHLILIFSFIIVLGISAEWLAWRLHIPAIVLLLLTGFLIGPVMGWINPAQDFGAMLQPLIALSVAIILFEGGLNLQWHEYKEAGVDVNRLVSIGLLLTWTLSATAAHFIGGLSWPIALIFGAIIVVTGPTVLLPLLKDARLQRRAAALLKWEGIINDPVGALLAVLVFEYLMTWHSGHSVFGVLGNLSLGLLVATASGIGLGYALSWAFHRERVPEFLKSPVMLGAVFLLYVAINAVQEEAGLLAVTVMGIVVANQRLRNIEDLRRFKQYITVVLVAVLFIVLTANIDIRTLTQLDGRSLALLAAIIFLIRPLAVYLSTLGTGIKWQERLLIAWIAPRGIVAASVAGLFASRLTERGFEDAEQLLPLVFALITATVILHGLTIKWLGRRLGLASRYPNGVLIVGATPWSVELAHAFKDLQVPVIITDTSWEHLRPARMSNLRVYRGQILAETTEAALELNEISHVLAATANDAYNALVCTRFAPELGHNQVFQLASVSGGNRVKAKEALARTVRGRIAFDENTRYEDLMRYYYHGWKFYKTRLTENYTYDDYIRDNKKTTLLIAIVTKLGQVVFYPLANLDAPQTGDSVISYGPPPDVENKLKEYKKEEANR